MWADGGADLSQYSRALGESIMNAPTQGSGPCSAPAEGSQQCTSGMGGASAHDKRRILDLWEPEEFQRILRRRGEFTFCNAVEAESEDMAAVCTRVRSKVIENLASWDTKPLADEADALHILALYAMEKCVWSPQNDVVAALAAAVVFGNHFRTHAHGISPETHSKAISRGWGF